MAPAVHPRRITRTMLLNVKQYGDPVLRAVSAPVEKITDDLKNLVENMLETMYATEGIGLAAPQVGILRRIVVIETEEDGLFELINPKIIVCLGRIAAKRLIDPEFRITRQHGTWVQKGDIWMTAIYHPSALLRDLSKRPETFEDLLSIREKLSQLK